LKNRKNRRALEAPPPDTLLPVDGGFTSGPLASGGWRRSPQTPSGLRRLEAPPTNPRKISSLPWRIPGYARGINYV